MDLQQQLLGHITIHLTRRLEVGIAARLGARVWRIGRRKHQGKYDSMQSCTRTLVVSRCRTPGARACSGLT